MDKKLLKKIHEVKNELYLPDLFDANENALFDELLKASIKEDVSPEDLMKYALKRYLQDKYPSTRDKF